MSIETTANAGTAIQQRLIPDEPLQTEMRRIPMASIPESETAGSRQPSPTMKESVARFGVLSPILVCPAVSDANDKFLAGGKGYYRLLAGRRRLLSARDAGMMIINAVVFPAGTTPREAVTLIENEQRSENPLVELEQIEEITRRGGTIEEICEATGMDKRRAENRMRLANLIPELRALLVKNQLAVGVAEDAAKLSREEQRAVYASAQDGKVRGKDIAKARQVKSLNASAALPFSMLSGGGEIDGGNDANRPAAMATGTLPASFTVALSGGGINPAVRADRAAYAPILSDTDLTEAIRAIRTYVEGKEQNGRLPAGTSETIGQVFDSLDTLLFIAGEAMTDKPGTAEPEQSGMSLISGASKKRPTKEAQEPTESSTPPGELIGVSGKQIQAASERRRLRREAARNARKEEQSADEAEAENDSRTATEEERIEQEANTPLDTPDPTDPNDTNETAG